jgi:integrase/recombinase XerD
MHREVPTVAKNSGGPFWTRTRDLSLIRIDNKRGNSSGGTPLPDYIDAWYNEQLLKGLAKSTVDCHRSRVMALLSVYLKPTESDIKNYLYQKQQAGYMSGTIANYIKAYRSFFGYLFTNGLYDLDYQRLKLPKITYRERRVPTGDEVRKLFQAIDNDEDKLALLLLVDCGIRVTELATIKLKNINLEDPSILINGKGGKTRNVYLSEMSVRYLKGYISSLNTAYLFQANRCDSNNGHRNRRFFETRLAELCERAGIEQITPHQLRHYFATHTLSSGADVKAVSEMLGHADVGITLKIYHHVNANSIRQMHQEHSPVTELVAVS